MPSDILTRLKKDPGDEQAWTGLYEQMRPWVYSLCFKWLGNFADAEDATQSTFIRLATNWRQSEFLDWPQLRKYLKKTAISRSIDLLRKRKSIRLPGLLTETSVESVSVPQSAHYPETLEELMGYLEISAVDRQLMSMREQQILWLSYLGYLNHEIADELGVTERTVGRDLHSLRNLLREKVLR